MTGVTQTQDEDGNWVEATPLPLYGWKAKLELRLRNRGMKRTANFLGWWDERGLGR